MSNKLRSIMADIVSSLTQVELMGKSQADTDKEVKRLYHRINCEVRLVRERFAAMELILTMLCEINSRKQCLAYQYNDELYCTANNVPGRKNTEYLHTLGLTQDQWNLLPQFTVWISTGNVYSSIAY